MKGKILNLFISSLLVLLAFGSIHAQRGGIYPNQFAKANQAKSIFEYNGTEWLWVIPNYVDSIYLVDSVLCWRIQEVIYCDTIRINFNDQIGTDTSGYNLDFRISNDTIFIRDGLGELNVVLPEYENTDTSGYNLDFRISNDTLYIRDGLGELNVKLPPGTVDTDNQDLSSSKNGNNVTVNITDGLSTSFSIADADSLATNELQVIDTFEIYNTNKLRISLSDDGQPFKSVDLPVYQDTQDLSIDSLGRRFEISLTDGGSVKFLDTNTDAQTLTVDSTATSVGITISNGNRIHFDVGELNTDNQKIDTFEVYDTNKLRISLEGDNEAFKTVTLPTYADTQDLSIDSTGRVFTISLTDGGSVKFEDTSADSSKWTRVGLDMFNKNRTDSVGINTTNPVRTLDVNGEMRVRDLQTGHARTLIAEIGDGTFQSVTIGKGIQLNSTTNTISSTERDSTVLNEGWGIDITESPTNTYTVKVDTSQVATQYDLSQISLIDSTALTAGYGISVSENSNNWTVNADTAVMATNWDLTQIESGMDSLFNGNRAISRVPAIGTNIGSTTFRGWLEYWYIQAHTPPTVSMNSISPTLVEIGTSNNYTLSGSITNSCSMTITSSTVDGTSFTPPSYSKSVNWQPTTVTTKTYTASVGWSETGSTCADGADSGTATASRSASSVHPVLWGMSASDWTSGTIPYANFKAEGASPNDSLDYKRIVTESDLTGLTMTGTNQYIYILIPKSWSVNGYTTSKIEDHNGFNVTGSFTAYDVSVTSTGLTNNWTQDYKMYKLNNLTTASGYNYKYFR